VGFGHLRRDIRRLCVTDEPGYGDLGQEVREWVVLEADRAEPDGDAGCEEVGAG
jgi:hypothetical protein